MRLPNYTQELMALGAAAQRDGRWADKSMCAETDATAPKT